MLTPTLQLICLIEGEDKVFPVTVVCDNNLFDLRKAIQEMRARSILKDIDPVNLELWKPKDSNPIAIEPRLTLGERIKLLGHDHSKFADNLGLETVSSIFPTQPDKHYIHIIVQVHITPLMRHTGSDPPVISSNVSLRKRTVEGLYGAMMEERLIYVRGTPGSGKSTLLDLLHQHILQQDPESFICVMKSWPPHNFSLSQEQKTNSYTCLKALIPGFPVRKSLAFLLMDEGQESFEDSFLWHSFLKDIIDKPSCYRVVIFCSYGSISTPGKGTRGGTPTDLKRAARMTLWPRKVKEGVELNGLLLDWDEFNEVVFQFHKELVIAKDLSQKIFELTAGHVGAVCELLRLILDKMKTRLRKEGQITLTAFNEELTNDYIMDNLAGAFSRGLPNSAELSSHPDIASVFQHLLVSGSVTECSDNCAAVQYCHRNGWIYAEDRLGPQSYTFASPLHHAALSWRLQARDHLPPYKNPYEMSLQAIAIFKPSQLGLPIRRVNGRSTDLPLEAQYQDEFYRSLVTVTLGNVCICPEFTSAQGEKLGWIDFFIPGVKWGIEIICEGDRLNNHASCFEAGAAYNKWLQDGNMMDYIILDCRTTTPKTSHSDIPNLYHVVFNKKYTEVCVLNNKREQVWGPKALQENH